jgi:hypothetical protein
MRHGATDTPFSAWCPPGWRAWIRAPASLRARPRELRQLNFGGVYRVLDWLATEGLIEHVLAESDSSRKLYRITEGPAQPRRFVLMPPTDAPRPLRQELAVKAVRRPRELPELLRLIDPVRAYMRQLSRGGSAAVARQVDAFVAAARRRRGLSVRAELAWRRRRAESRASGLGMIEFCRVSRIFGAGPRRCTPCPISVHLSARAFWTFMGPSGSGKAPCCT